MRARATLTVLGALIAALLFIAHFGAATADTCSDSCDRAYAACNKSCKKTSTDCFTKCINEHESCLARCK